MAIRRLLLLSLVVLVAGCGSGHSAVSPQSGQQRSIAGLFWVMMGAAWLGFGVVVFLIFLGWLRHNRAQLPFGGGEGVATGLVLLLGVAVPIVVLAILFVWADIFVVRSTAAPRPGTRALTIEVTGHQWFWEVRYRGTGAVTANEIHIPVGARVRVVGKTDDVIHSFWVPALNRKIDLIPGRRNTLLLQADRPGVFRGQCSESTRNGPLDSGRGCRTWRGRRGVPAGASSVGASRFSSRSPARAATPSGAPRRAGRSART